MGFGQREMRKKKRKKKETRASAIAGAEKITSYGNNKWEISE